MMATRSHVQHTRACAQQPLLVVQQCGQRPCADQPPPCSFICDKLEELPSACAAKNRSRAAQAAVISKRAQLEECIPTWLQRIYWERQRKLQPNNQPAGALSESQLTDAAAVTIRSTYAVKPSQADGVVPRGHGLDPEEAPGHSINEPLQRVRRVPLGELRNSSRTAASCADSTWPTLPKWSFADTPESQRIDSATHATVAKHSDGGGASSSLRTSASPRTHNSNFSRVPAKMYHRLQHYERNARASGCKGAVACIDLISTPGTIMNMLHAQKPISTCSSSASSSSNACSTASTASSIGAGSAGARDQRGEPSQGNVQGCLKAWSTSTGAPVHIAEAR